ncbi:MAG: type II toxin-antitoxin system VapC family toxin [Microbacterium sp.]|uniref:type II toxin-antitoxin system VapC family toxin n=1 Tax=Microbacterium sp. TaxID=51671 RepID=UPI002722900F|nr:type II toxin-antitoxin system VapC family toxin [Microbacterium sp.]MDO8382754.1 type II toxin-antitoxin system VapC family toxin [Microbacterium sp.]
MIVVDASVLANALADDSDDGERARARLLSENRLVAPELIDVEVASVFRRRWLAGDLDEERLALAIADLAAVGIERMPMRQLMSRVIDLRRNVTPYDAVYVALAEVLGCSLLTADQRLALAPGPRCEIEALTSRR